MVGSLRPQIDPPRRRPAVLLSVVLSMLLWSVPNVSTAVMEGLSTEELTRRSDLVVVGDVESVAAAWSDDRTTIHTTAALTVAEVVKGRSADRRIEVEYPGGEVGDIGLKVSDEPGMKKGERVLLFLKRAAGPGDANRYKLVGKGQGKYSIGPDGVARKRGFSLVGDATQVDADIPLGTLLEKIKRAE